jgi:hypothetical protein
MRAPQCSKPSEAFSGDRPKVAELYVGQRMEMLQEKGRARNGLPSEDDDRASPPEHTHLPEMWIPESGDDADRRMSLRLRVHELSRAAEAEARRLLRLLLVRVRKMPARAGRVELLRVTPNHPGHT